MQSPQKLRERLQAEQQAITAAQISLQDELHSIGEELNATPSRMGSVRGTSKAAAPTPNSLDPARSMDLTQRVLALEAKLPHITSTVETRLSGIAADVTSSLSVSEAKCKHLDELYREANGENEALYGRFNDELGKILKAVRGGDGVEELKRLLRESQEEVATLKREGMRLKRENVGLRAQLKEG
jgi:chromosome segregation ATPase